jgi:hypothetical protein
MSSTLFLDEKFKNSMFNPVKNSLVTSAEEAAVIFLGEVD